MRLQRCLFIIFLLVFGASALAQTDTDRHGPPNRPSYQFPQYLPKYNKVAEALWEKTKRYYDMYQSTFANKRYVTMINLGKHSTQERFYVLDLQDGSLQTYLTSHGAGSDPDKDGYPDKFSNEIDSRASSLGAYETIDTYVGKNGRSLRLKGLEASNSNALDRAIVIHGAPYVNEKNRKVGMSWGCPALDDNIAQPIIDRLQNGSLLMIDSVK